MKIIILTYFFFSPYSNIICFRFFIIVLTIKAFILPALTLCAAFTCPFCSSFHPQGLLPLKAPPLSPAHIAIFISNTVSPLLLSFLINIISFNKDPFPQASSCQGHSGFSQVPHQLVVTNTKYPFSSSVKNNNKKKPHQKLFYALSAGFYVLLLLRCFYCFSFALWSEKEKGVFFVYPKKDFFSFKKKIK